MIIVFMDGKTKIIEDGDSTKVLDQVLHVYSPSIYGRRELLGSFPLANIREWKK